MPQAPSGQRRSHGHLRLYADGGGAQPTSGAEEPYAEDSIEVSRSAREQMVDYAKRDCLGSSNVS